jgi:carboxyl-terminal processing protease
MVRHALISALVFSFSTSGPAQTARISTEASAHLTDIISVLQREWLHRDTMDWDTFRQRVVQKAGAAQAIPETYDAIRLALTLLGDKHSYYVTASGEYIYNPQSPTQSTGECMPAPLVTPPLPDGVSYVRIQITPATPPPAIQEALRKGDGTGTIGWIVDLRNSRGGNTWPALAGIGSLLGEGTAGFFVDAADHATAWGYTNGEAWLDMGEKTGHQTTALVDRPYRFVVSNPRVAVLTDIGVASSGEAIAIAFRGRPNTRSFGTPTCGLSTAVSQLPLANGGRIGVVTSVMADRTMKKYGGAVHPDELVTEPAEVVPRAMAWLRGPL